MTHNPQNLSGDPSKAEVFSTLIPARLDRLPWSRFHWLLVIGLGITWVLDGLEVTLMGAISAVLQRPDVLHFSAAEIGSISSAYLAGAVVGSLIFGHLTDRFGRRMFFFLSLSVYLVGVGLTGLSWNLMSFGVFRFITGMGIGGEYSAVNSAIDELIPARLRGRVDLIINGSYWLGAALGAASTLVILDPHILPVTIGWRVGFGAGAIIGLIVLFLREFIPESPRWLMTHGRCDEAEKTVREVEEEVAREMGVQLEPADSAEAIRIKVRHDFGLGVILKPMVTKYRSRTVLGLALMIAQAFVYNAIFFTYALVLNRYFGVKADAAGLYLLPFALSNFLGPLLLGHFFDTIGRRPMIAGTFAIAGSLLIVTGYLFAHGALSAPESYDLVDGNVFLRVAGREFGLSDRQRDFSARDACIGDRAVLFGRHGSRRNYCAVVFRPSDRYRITWGADGRLHGRRCANDRCGDCRDRSRGGGRRREPRKNCRAAVVGELGTDRNVDHVSHRRTTRSAT